MSYTSTSTGPSRFRAVGLMLLVALLYFLLTRLVLTGYSYSEAELGLLDLVKVYFVGLVYDLAFYSYALIPVALYLLLAPNKLWQSRMNKGLVHLVSFATIYGLGFIAVAEYLFWNEFQVRFNFISVDYLVYRREVTDNINESYPIPLLLTLIFLVTLVVYRWFGPRIHALTGVSEPFARRLRIAAALLILPVISFYVLGQDLKELSKNNYGNELASNGPYQFIAAFRNNELEYEDFYRTLDEQTASNLLKSEFGNSDSQELFNIVRDTDNPGQEKRLNVFLVMIESFSADFMGTFGNKEGWTPNLDNLVEKSLLFEKFYATGTRTTRGLEAVTLSIPPTPGRSIVKRLGHESGMYSLGNILKSKGYDTKFIYGGRGYFDNMNAFFSGNGYDIVDQSTIPENEVIFSNAWGVSDEDLYRQAMKEADGAYAEGKPFFFHLMTTSNHRPFTYPEGRIDIPSGSGRPGAVKYTDWAIGDLIKKVESKPWFDDTLFVFVSDHTAGSAGKSALPVAKYHIPFLVYAPGQVKAGRVDKVASQVDVAPTLLAMLNMDYSSAFFGKNILQMTPDEERAFIGNYQRLGLYTPGRLSILSPKKMMTLQENPESGEPVSRDISEPDQQMKRDIAYYQGAAYIYKNRINAWPSYSGEKLAHGN